jgi:hypothetical protein
MKYCSIFASYNVFVVLITDWFKFCSATVVYVVTTVQFHTVYVDQQKFKICYVKITKEYIKT